MSPAVLLVESEFVRRNEIGRWLEDAGYEVLGCPGPSAPDYTCIAACGTSCPLAEAADVVVLDMQLASDDAMQGLTGWELLIYYMERGERVVALSGQEDSVRPRDDEGVTVLRRPVDRAELIEAVRGLSPRRIPGDG
jgi:CheY-like chemotaxis protein